MQKLIEALQKDHRDIQFEFSDKFMWSPRNNVVHIEANCTDMEAGTWSLLHEVGHARLHHSTYRDDFELLIMEVAAWREAKSLAGNYDIQIPDSYIDTCLDSYRNWLYLRSRCVECGTNSFQENLEVYRCHNCTTRWEVPTSRLCHIRRRRI